LNAVQIVPAGVNEENAICKKGGHGGSKSPMAAPLWAEKYQNNPDNFMQTLKCQEEPESCMIKVLLPPCPPSI
jgi:hypothetical protein